MPSGCRAGAPRSRRSCSRPRNEGNDGQTCRNRPPTSKPGERTYSSSSTGIVRIPWPWPLSGGASRGSWRSSASNGPKTSSCRRSTVQAGELIVHGACLKAEMADQLARALVKESHDLHWEVGRSRKLALLHRAGGGPWTFELPLKDLPLVSGLAAPATKPAVPHRR